MPAMQHETKHEMKHETPVRPDRSVFIAVILRVLVESLSNRHYIHPTHRRERRANAQFAKGKFYRRLCGQAASSMAIPPGPYPKPSDEFLHVTLALVV